MTHVSDVREYLEESIYCGTPKLDTVEDLFKDCVLYLSIALAPFPVNRKAVLRDLNDQADLVAQLVK